MLVYKFDGYTLSEDGELTYHDNTISIPPKELALLVLFVNSQGSLLSKEKIIETVWYGCCVSDESVTRCIYALRRILGKNKNYIKTFYSRGYKFTPSVSIVKKCPIVEKKINNGNLKEYSFSMVIKTITYSTTFQNLYTHQTFAFRPLDEKKHYFNNRKQ